MPSWADGGGAWLTESAAHKTKPARGSCEVNGIITGQARETASVPAAAGGALEAGVAGASSLLGGGVQAAPGGLEPTAVPQPSGMGRGRLRRLGDGFVLNPYENLHPPAACWPS